MTKPITIRKLYETSDAVRLPLRELFNVKCNKCKSANVDMQTEESVDFGGGGCETCGYGGEGSWKFWLGLKCKDCGNAKVIFKDNY